MTDTKQISAIADATAARRGRLGLGRSTLYKHLDINHPTNTEHDLAS